MKNNKLDSIDKKILELLTENARMPLKDIAKEVFLTAPAVATRINHLIENNYITGFHACLNPELLGYHVKAYIFVALDPKDKASFYPFVENTPGVIQCDCVTGDYSMALQVQFKSTVELDEFIGELQVYGRTNTLIVFSTAVEHRDVSVM